MPFIFRLREIILDYVFSARNISKGAFGSEPGPTRFLRVPAGDTALAPSQGITRRAWYDAVTAEAQVRRDPQSGRLVGDVLIFIHGFNTPQQTVLDRHRRIRRGLEALGYKGVVVSFDWPCATTAINYLEDRTDAKLTALRLVDDGIAPFSRFMRPDCEISVHVLAHSMGCYVLREAFDDADDRPAIAGVSWTVSQIMVCGGDVSAESMGTSPTSSSLYRHCVRLTNYSNPYDAVLSISNVKRLGVSPRVGRVGLPANAPSKAVNVDVGPYFDAHREGFDSVANADHTFYFYDASFLRDVFLTLTGNIDRSSIPGRFVENGKLYLAP